MTKGIFQNRGVATALGLSVWISVLMGFGSGDALSAELVFRSAAGYTSNPAAETDAKGSGFAEHSLWLGDGFIIADTLQLDIGTSANYQILNEFSNNHQFTLDLTLSRIATPSRVSPYLFAGATVFRDSLIPSDDRNEVIFGAGAEITLSGRLSLIVEPSYQYARYTEDAQLLFLPPMDRAPELSILNNSAQMLNDTIDEVYDARREHAFIFDIRLNLFMTPKLTTTARLNFEYSDSSQELESYRQLTPSVGAFWEITDQCQLTLEGSIAAKRYIDIENIAPNNAPPTDALDPNEQQDGSGNQSQNNENGMLFSSAADQVNDIDDLTLTPRLDVGLHFFPDANLDIFTTFSLEHGEYPLNGENYTEKVIRCGFSWSF